VVIADQSLKGILGVCSGECDCPASISQRPEGATTTFARDLNSGAQERSVRPNRLRDEFRGLLDRPCRPASELLHKLLGFVVRVVGHGYEGQRQRVLRQGSDDRIGILVGSLEL